MRPFLTIAPLFGILLAGASAASSSAAPETGLWSDESPFRDPFPGMIPPAAGRGDGGTVLWPASQRFAAVLVDRPAIRGDADDFGQSILMRDGSPSDAPTVALSWSHLTDPTVAWPTGAP